MKKKFKVCFYITLILTFLFVYIYYIKIHFYYWEFTEGACYHSMSQKVSFQLSLWYENTRNRAEIVSFLENKDNIISKPELLSSLFESLSKSAKLEKDDLLKITMLYINSENEDLILSTCGAIGYQSHKNNIKLSPIEKDNICNSLLMVQKKKILNKLFKKLIPETIEILKNS